MIYLTYAEPPSGVYSSQVIDVIKYLNSIGGRVRLVAFISLHDFKKTRQKIKGEIPDAIVMPMLPKADYWQLNVITLFFICVFTGEYSIIARNVIATNMALILRKTKWLKKVCFDGRGAIAAEWKEYDVKVVNSWKKNIDQLERKAVVQSDFRIAVTTHLIKYWIKNYDYSSTNHVVIPCTVNSSFTIENNSASATPTFRDQLGFTDNDVVFAYSGSTAGWQSFETLNSFISPLMKADTNYKIIFLAKSEKSIDQLKLQYPNQVAQKWVAHQEVTAILSACDYGILIREQSITNQVASPTKFAEYLSAGLPVIISANLGDYSDFVEKHHCGISLNNKVTSIDKPTLKEKERMKELVNLNFTKEANNDQYKTLLMAMN